jgi:uncharacterized protein with PQ loop repeat
MHYGLHHIHARQRVARGLEPFPSRSARRRLFDRLMLGVGVLQPIALLPQVVAVYTQGGTEGIALSTWMLFVVFNLLWIGYGVVHRAIPIIIANALFACLNVAIVLGVLYY